MRLTGELLKGLASGLWDEERGKDTAEHEESKNLHDMIDPWVAGIADAVFLSTLDLEWPKHDLCDNGTDLARSCGDTVGSRTVAGGEALAGNDESGSIGPLECSVSVYSSLLRWQIAELEHLPKLKKNWQST